MKHALNVTVTNATSGGFITAFADQTSMPLASNLNFAAGQTVPNLVIAPVGTDGKIALYNGSAGTIDLITDLAGYYLTGPPTTPGTYGSVTPLRVLDTRNGTGAVQAVVQAGQTVSVAVLGRGGVPAAGVAAVAVNVTVTNATSGGFITAFADQTSMPLASNLNFAAGQTVPNLVIAPVGTDGKIALYNGSAGTIDLITDLAGYYTGAPESPTTDDATSFQENPTHDGNAPGIPLPATLTKQWSTNLGGPVSYPIIAGDRVFVAASRGQAGADGIVIYGFDLATGNQLWDPISLAGTVWRPDLAYDDNKLFAVTAEGVVHGFDATTGQDLWSRQVPGNTEVTSPPVATGGLLFVVGSFVGGTIYAFDETTGGILWSRAVVNGQNSAPTVGGGAVYVSYLCVYTFSFSLTGTVNWVHVPACEGGGGLTTVLHGNELWVRDVDSGIIGSTSGTIFSPTSGVVVGHFTSSTPPVISGSTVLETQDGLLSAIDTTTGAALWTQPASAGIDTAPVISGDTVYVGSNTGNVYGYSLSTGQQTWSAQTGSPIAALNELAAQFTSLAIGDGALVVPATNELVVYK